MHTKMTSAIERITLNAATFRSEAAEPTLINFFYGNNGTGKSTIAREIAADSGLTWQSGKSAADYSALVYNQEFIDANFRNYGILKGVFTVGEQNIEIQNSIAEKVQQKAEQDKLAAEQTRACFKRHKGCIIKRARQRCKPDARKRETFWRACRSELPHAGRA